MFLATPRSGSEDLDSEQTTPQRSLHTDYGKTLSTQTDKTVVGGTTDQVLLTKPIAPVVKVDQRIRWQYSDYTITILSFRIGAWQHEVSKL